VGYQTRFDPASPYRRDQQPGGDGASTTRHPPGFQASQSWGSGSDYERREQERLEHERMIEIRNAALLRMREVNSRHGMHAFDERFGGDALGPHALAFLYVDIGQDAGQSARYVVRAATRLFRDSDDVRHLPTLLTTLARIAHGYVRRGGFDPRQSMAHRTDAMSPQARYVGLGVSSLDTLAGPWEDVRNHARSAMEVAGRSYVHLVDDTRMILDRGGSFGAVGTTYSSRPLEAGAGLAFASWRPLHRRTGDFGDDVWDPLALLNQQVHHGIHLLSQPGRRPR
jgi:hypothetical protein